VVEIVSGIAEGVVISGHDFGDVGGDGGNIPSRGEGRYDVSVSKSTRPFGTATTKGRVVVTRILLLLFLYIKDHEDSRILFIVTGLIYMIPTANHS
jgi:hypothetical protein